MQHDVAEYRKLELTDKGVAEYLGPNLHGAFFNFDNLIRRADLLEENKREVIQSLTIIVDLMGQKHITRKWKKRKVKLCQIRINPDHPFAV